MRIGERLRKVLPSRLIGTFETIYRRSRTAIVSTWYSHPSRYLRVIAVTGTNGKTTTANFINAILKQAGYRTAMFTTAVIEIAGQSRINDLNATVPSTRRIQQFFRDAQQAAVDYVILEVTSHSLDQHKLDGVLFEGAVMTNLTQDHLDYHKTMGDYAATKAKLFQRQPRFIVLNHDDQWFSYYDKFTAGQRKMTVGTSAEAGARITDIKLHREGSEASLAIGSQPRLDLATVFPGEFNVYNMAAAATLAHLLGISREDIQHGVASLKTIPGRFEQAVTGLGYDVIVDYAHTPDALDKLLATARAITNGRVILVFGACGDRDQSKRPIMGGIAVHGADRIFLTDEESYDEDPAAIREMIRAGIKHADGEAKTQEIPDRKEAIERAMSSAKPGDMILITGMGHEQFRIVNGKRLPWNDTDVVREIADQLDKIR